MYSDPTVVNRFWRRVVKSEGCWEWTGGHTSFGHGVIRIGGKYGPLIYVHRLSYELAYGDVGAGLVVAHHCDNPPCVRPDHLFACTQAENLADMRRKGRGSKPPLRWATRA